MKKMLLIVLDGMGDRPNPEFGFKTALQAAYRPNMNELATRGRSGLMAPVREGIVCGSDTSHLSLLGYDPEKIYTGRGPFEAMGLGMRVEPGDIAFRANFATRDKKGLISDRRAGRHIKGSAELAKSLCITLDGVEFMVKEGVEHRAGLVMRGDNLSAKISDSDPHSAGKAPNRILPLDEGAKRTADILNKYLSSVRKILDEHSVNVDRSTQNLPSANELLLRGAGVTPKLEPFEQKYQMKGACLAGIPMITGIATLAGMHILKHDKATGRVDTDYTGKVNAAVEALKRYDYVLLNIKAPDIAGHDGNAILKRDVLQLADKAFEQLHDITGDTVLCITGDHSTPCVTKEHSGDPVPILLTSEGNLSDNSKNFDEASASRGSLRICSGDVMTIMRQMSDRLEKYGA